MHDDTKERDQCLTLPVDRWFIEKASGKDTNRPKLQEMLGFIREDDVVYVEEFSRLGRSTTTPSGRLQMTMMAAIAEFERDMILERQREGIAIAKAAGKYKGRKKISIQNIGEYYEKYMTRQGTKVSIAAELGISRTTLDRLFNKYEEEQESLKFE